ncbi:MAG: carboxypeptidase-like regulatory domain-containing protein [Acidobacteriota bacterium]
MIFSKKGIKIFIILLSVLFLLNTLQIQAKRTIYGKITSSKGNKPIAGAIVTAYDSDPGPDQKMKSTKTDSKGNYRIKYRDGAWDGKKTKHHTSWRPDIYIVVVAPEHHKGKSKKYNNQKLKNDRKINLKLRYMEGARTIQGIVKDSSGRAVAGALVTACDSDPGNDELMGTAKTSSSGAYKITYKAGSWDGPKTDRHTQWRPDVYIVVSKNNYKKYKSREYGNHKLADKLTINAKISTMNGKVFPRSADMCNWKKSDAERCREKGSGYIWIGPEGRLGRCIKQRSRILSLQKKYKHVKNIANLSTPRVLGYLAYFEVIVGSGSTMRSLPQDVRDKLRKYYGKIIDKVKYGSSRHTSGENTAMTDCYDIFFPAGRGAVKAIKNNLIFTEGYGMKLHLLLHELYHSSQCSSWGGRYNYANKWFSQIPVGTIGAILSGFTKRKARSIHDEMPMESAAEKKADQVMISLGYKKSGKDWIK